MAIKGLNIPIYFILNINNLLFQLFFFYYLKSNIFLSIFYYIFLCSSSLYPNIKKISDTIKKGAAPAYKRLSIRAGALSLTL